MEAIRIFLLVVAGVLLFNCTGIQADSKVETYYVDKHCHGQKEVRLKDNTRVDCLTEEYAYEYDWAYKWSEAIGQALHYARMTGKKPGIVLIIGDLSDLIYLKRTYDVLISIGIQADLTFVFKEN